MTGIEDPDTGDYRQKVERLVSSSHMTQSALPTVSSEPSGSEGEDSTTHRFH